MIEVHLLLALEEEVIDKLLLPVAVGVPLEAADAGVDEVQVQHGDVRPCAEGRGELEGCCHRIISKTSSEGKSVKASSETYSCARHCPPLSACPLPRRPPT